MFGGSFFASTAQVWSGAKLFGGLVSAGGITPGLKMIADNVSNAFTTPEHIKQIRQALKQLNATSLRPGQTEVRANKIMNIVAKFDTMKAHSSVYYDGTVRYLTDGHHTTIASTILGESGPYMGMVASDVPLATNVYWYKNWWEFWKTAIKIVE